MKGHQSGGILASAFKLKHVFRSFEEIWEIVFGDYQMKTIFMKCAHFSSLQWGIFFLKLGKSHLDSIGKGAEYRPLRTPKKKSLGSVLFVIVQYETAGVQIFLKFSKIVVCYFGTLTLLHSERPKLYTVLALLVQ